MKLVIGLLVSLSLVGCVRGTGQITGKVVDVTYRGFFFPSCEIVIQKGEGSSSMDQSSSRDKAFCDKAEGLAGKTVTIKYATEVPAILTSTPDIIKSIEEVK